MSETNSRKRRKVENDQTDKVPWPTMEQVRKSESEWRSLLEHLGELFAKIDEEKESSNLENEAVQTMKDIFDRFVPLQEDKKNQAFSADNVVSIDDHEYRKEYRYSDDHVKISYVSEHGQGCEAHLVKQYIKVHVGDKQVCDVSNELALDEYDSWIAKICPEH